MYQPNTAPPYQYYPYWPEPDTKPNSWNFQYQWWFTCPHCGAAITWQGAYCPHCGKKIAETSSKEETLNEIKKLLEEVNKKLDSLSETKTGEKE